MARGIDWTNSVSGEKSHRGDWDYTKGKKEKEPKGFTVTVTVFNVSRLSQTDGADLTLIQS